MAEEIPSIEDPAELSEKLAEILLAGSLYRAFVYRGKACHASQSTSYGRKRYGQLPKQMFRYCDHKECKTQTKWETGSEAVYFGNEFIEKRSYTCRNCGKETQYYLLIWQEHEDVNLFIKVGQWPALTIEPSTELAKALGPDDTKLYKKGLIDFNFGHGIGAVGYFRRVLENKINALLDLMLEAARNAEVGSEQLAEVESIKNSRRVEDKIAVASKILPSSLKPGGHNPLDKLYKPLSAGLHGETDDECLTIFSEARFVFEYLFKNLTENNEEARRYVKELSAPFKSAARARTSSLPEAGK